MAATAEKSVIGILAAGILKYEFEHEGDGEVPGGRAGEPVE